MSGRQSPGTHTLVSVLILACSIALVSGCSDPRPTASTGTGGGTGGDSKACTPCHGDATRQDTTTNPRLSASPPKGTKGETDVTARAVGAHQLHLQDGAIRAAVACAECHVVPTTTAHANGKVDLTFGSLATSGGAAPLWNGSSCSASYCHGGFPGGNAANAPVWTQARASSCGTCHGLPPAAPHPDVGTGSNCGSCHTGYSATTVNLATHMDGKVDVANLSCTSCHGDSTRADTTVNPRFSAAPPRGSKGETATTTRAVGAHALHLKDGNSLSCTECHVVPTSTSHANGTAEVTFGPLSKTGGATPAWNGAGCASSYCHGNFKNGNPSYVPTWTSPAANACGTCHGLPPGGNHPANSACESCHAGYTIGSVNVTTHLNGSIDVIGLSCTSCHGTAGRSSVAGADLNQAAAPPLDSAGATTGVRVGTHLSHVNPAAAGAVYKPVACIECHPNNAGNFSHSNNAINVTFAAATGANLGSFSPTFVQGNGTTTQTTCATYCHGSSLNATTTRGSVASWTWNGAAASCGSCHKSPPGTANHHNAAALTTCNKCHSGTVDAAGAVLVSGGLHVNGAIDTANLSCTTCHGNATLVASGTQDPNVAAAPTGVGAPDTYGNTTVASNGVGVHAAHVLGTRSRPVLCNACHTVPGTQIHKTGVVTAGTVVLANLSTTGGIATAAYAGAGGTCSNTYCHGNFAGGAGAIATPTWKTSAALACTACHGAPPALTAASHHPGNTSCATCHGAGYTASTVVAATHVDGTVTLSRTGCTLCHGDLTQTAVANTSAASAPGFNASAADTTGATAATSAAVGAHAAHLTGTRWRSSPLACNECHAVPARGRRRPRDGRGLGRCARHGDLRRARHHRHHHHRGLRGQHHCVRCERRRHLLERVLPWQLQERRDDAGAVVAGRRGRGGVRFLPRPASRRESPRQLGLRELPRRLHHRISSTSPTT